MPNHVRHTLKIDIANDALRQQILNDIAVRDDKGTILAGTIDFERIMPMPSCIYRGPLGDKEMKQYGKNNWYNWSIENWGTKWNAYDFGDPAIPSAQDDEVDLSFATAWSTPKKVMVALSKKYPDVTFKITYADEMLGTNCGEYWIKDGELEKDDVPETETERLTLGLKVWDLIPQDVGLRFNPETGEYEDLPEEDFEGSAETNEDEGE